MQRTTAVKRVAFREDEKCIRFSFSEEKEEQTKVMKARRRVVV